jgi:phage recombination protein Bet
VPICSDERSIKVTESVALEVSQRGSIAVTTEQVAIARNTVAKGLNDDQFAVFLYNCQRQGIHPLDGLLVPIVRKDNQTGELRLTFVTTVDLLRSRAAEGGDYAGSDDPIFEYNPPASNPQSATVTVWKIVQGMKCSFVATARWEEYYPGDKQGFMWKSKPHVMVGKCAEALALRKAFPKQLAGLYLAEELQKEPVEKVRTPKKPVGDVMCNECRAVNGHLPSCPHRKAATAEPQKPVQEQQPAPKAETPSEQPNGLETMLLQVSSVEVKTRKAKNGKEQAYRALNVMSVDGSEWMLYAWDTKHFPQLDAILPKTNCVFDVKAAKSGDRTYYSVENIVEIGGKPTAAQGELLDPEPGWND